MKLPSNVNYESQKPPHPRVFGREGVGGMEIFLRKEV
jgi:hypothetical protein